MLYLQRVKRDQRRHEGGVVSKGEGEEGEFHYWVFWFADVWFHFSI